MGRSRRATGTRTMLDVLRHGFRPPTEAQKTADAHYVADGGELAVAAKLMLMSQERRSGIHWLPQGRLLVTNASVTWKPSPRTGLADLRFARGEWIVRTTPHTQASRVTPSVLLSFVNEFNRTVH